MRSAAPLTGIDQLRALVVAAPDDTTFTAVSLRRYLADEANPAVLATPALTAAEVASAVAKALGMRVTPQAGSIRKWVRTGLHGVKLEAFPSGHGYAYSSEAVQAFIAAVKSKKQRSCVPPPPFLPSADPAEEIAAYAREGAR